MSRCRAACALSLSALVGLTLTLITSLAHAQSPVAIPSNLFTPKVGMRVESVNTNQVKLTWVANGNTWPGGTTGDIWRSIVGQAGSSVPVATGYALSNKSFTDNNVVSGTTYEYTIYWQDPSNNWYSESVQIATGDGSTWVNLPTLTPVKSAFATNNLASQMGVNVYFRTYEPTTLPFADIDRALSAGFRHIRVDMLPSGSLPYFDFSGYTSLIDKITTYNTNNPTKKVEIIFILRLWSTPATQTDYDTYSTFCNQAAYYCRNKPVRFELWNEPNYGVFFNNPSPAAYLPVLVAGLNGVSSGSFYGGGTTLIPSCTGGLLFNGLNANSFLDTLLPVANGSNVSSQTSAIGLHPYAFSTSQAPEVRAVALQATRTILANKGVANKPVWDTELGYTSAMFNASNEHVPDLIWQAGTTERYTRTDQDGTTVAAEKRQAVWNVRSFLTNGQQGVALSTLHAMRNRPIADVGPQEGNFGLLNVNGTDKPNMKAVTRLLNVTASNTYAGSLTGLSTGLNVMKLTNATTGNIYVLWLSRKGQQLKVSFPINNNTTATAFACIPSGTNYALVTSDVAVFNPAGTNVSGVKNISGSQVVGDLYLTEESGPVYLRIR
jgi:hypothetical protein